MSNRSSTGQTGTGTDTAPPSLPPRPPRPVQPRTYPPTIYTDLLWSAIKPSAAHLATIAERVGDMLQARGVEHAFVGGWAMWLRGNGRVPRNLDVAIGVGLEVIRPVVLAESRWLLWPSNSGSVHKVVMFARGWDKESSSKKYTVKVDFYVHGFLYIPSPVSSGVERISPVQGRGTQEVSVLQLAYEVAAKLCLHTAKRSFTREHFDDMQWLCLYYEETIAELALLGALDYNHRERFCLDMQTGNAMAHEWAHMILHIPMVQ